MSALWTAGGTAPHVIDDTNEKVKSWQEWERRGINYQTSVYIHRIYKWMNDRKCHGICSLKGKRGFCQGRQNVSESFLKTDAFSILVMISEVNLC